MRWHNYLSSFHQEVQEEKDAEMEFPGRVNFLKQLEWFESTRRCKGVDLELFKLWELFKLLRAAIRQRMTTRNIGV